MDTVIAWNTALTLLASVAGTFSRGALEVGGPPFGIQILLHGIAVCTSADGGNRLI